MQKELTLSLDVTPEDIDRGCAKNAGNCPVARAVNRAFGALGFAGHASVTGESVAFKVFGGGYWWAALPIGVSRWIAAFDNGVEVEPFALDLEWEWVPQRGHW